MGRIEVLALGKLCSTTMLLLFFKNICKCTIVQLFETILNLPGDCADSGVCGINSISKKIPNSDRNFNATVTFLYLTHVKKKLGVFFSFYFVFLVQVASKIMFFPFPSQRIQLDWPFISIISKFERNQLRNAIGIW